MDTSSGWEWRIFFPITQAEYDGRDKDPSKDLWSLLSKKLGRRITANHPEVRIDEYYVLPNTSFGLKARGGGNSIFSRGNLLELKVRKAPTAHDNSNEKEDNGGCEKWSKVIATSIPKGNNLKEELKYVHKVLNNSHTHSDVAHYVEQIMHDLDRDQQQQQQQPLVKVTFKKKRVQHHLDSVTVEQTDLCIPIDSKHHPYYYRSICVEGTRRDVLQFVNKYLLASSPSSSSNNNNQEHAGASSTTTTTTNYSNNNKQLLLSAGGGHSSLLLMCKPMGYPEFLLRLVDLHQKETAASSITKDQRQRN